ncbi:Transcriptional regulatory protein ZraR [Fundidesulfovibrio magnetotacticus]|uniref:Transcriptional regulatory protein ZraR n=1 Tax=Fundidesulfovibrio magnetotacticus TaxID=2730080 RepID=A0A6V8LYV2_9BACT|nr:sigma-54 dependent transcriptional regulator [Fundidesulfovibrio magnetotacticus]GFK95970.1 Transcriptional regulatory protein ZraR [Fundidesulfovibrio magnetotacticus]
MSERILVIEDDPSLGAMIQDALDVKGLSSRLAGSAEEGLELLGSGSYELVLTDVMLPGMSGVEAIPRILAAQPGVDVIVMTGQSTREVALEAIRHGAYDYFSKPFSLAELETVIRRALERRALRDESRALRRRLRDTPDDHGLVGQSEPMLRLKELVAKVAALDVTVLVTGESGTGKEVVADAIHALSPRASGPFVKVNCAAIPENLLESELFGHEKGAFTGALTARKGKFELAAKGSLLLDELGDMPLFLQPKLLRAVESKMIERLGAPAPMPVDVRIIAATHQDLPRLVEERAFRADLFYRLSIAQIRIPPLRDRREDIPLLAEHFIRRLHARTGCALEGLSRDGAEALMAQPWPGNVRQLANAIERAAITAPGPLFTARDCLQALGQAPAATAQPPALRPGMNLRQTLEDVERGLILEALRQAGGVQKEAARLLGLSPTNLWNKLQKHGIPGHGGGA